LAITSLRATSLFAVASLAAGLAAQGPANDVFVPGSKSVVTPQVQTPGTPGNRIQVTNVIYENGPLFNLPGAGASGANVSEVNAGLDSAGANCNNPTFRVADNFEVPPGQMWYVSEVVGYAYQTGSTTTSSFTAGFLQIWSGDPSSGGTVVFGDAVTNRLTSSVFSNTYRIFNGASPLLTSRPIMENTMSAGVLLKPGTYYVDMSFNGTIASGPWYPAVALPANGNAIQWQSTLWAPFAGLIANPAGTQREAPFKLCGEVACCFENDMGAVLTPNGDDVAYRNLPVPAFAMPGGLGNTTAIDVVTNGYVYLQTNLLSADFSPAVADLLTNPARICAPWNDYDSTAGGNVRIRTTALRTIVTWDRIATFGVTPSASIAQLQMFPNGTFTLNSWTITQGPSSWNTPIFGVSSGNGAADPGETDFSAGPVSTSTGTVYEIFSNSTGADLYDLNGRLFCFAPNAAGGFDVSSEAACCQLASNAPVGPGCFGFSTTVVNNAIAGGTAHLASVLPVGTLGQVTLLGGLPTPFALDLSIVGAPTCFLHHSNDLFSIPMDGAGNSFLPLPCLSFLLGFPLQAQGVAIAPGLNAGGLATGDAWSLVIGNL
jgi:hypothetical protein